MTKVHENDDLWYALENNPLEELTPEDIVDICAEVPGENDEFTWWWIVKLRDDRYVLLEGWCDYTGWDCQSTLDVEIITSTSLEAAIGAPEQDYSGRAIRLNLMRQLNGTNPKFTYIADDSDSDPGE
jgi:hypothetical protein